MTRTHIFVIDGKRYYLMPKDGASGAIDHARYRSGSRAWDLLAARAVAGESALYRAVDLDAPAREAL